MTRTEFLKSVITGATAVKAIGATMPDGSAPKNKRLLAIEIDMFLGADQYAAIRRQLAKYEERYGVEFMILSGGMRVVDPSIPTPAGRLSSHTVKLK